MTLSITETYALSLRSDLAIGAAAGSLTVQLAKIDLNYKGRLIIHTAAYKDAADEQEALRNLAERGWTSEQVPARSILGWCVVKEIFPYNQAMFERDADEHWYGKNLLAFQGQEGWLNQPVYGYKLIQQHLLKLPIMGVGDKPHGTFWQPETPFEVTCFKMAFDKDRENIDVEAVS